MLERYPGRAPPITFAPSDSNDAHLRNYSVVVPADCVAAIDREDGRHALGYMQRALNARVVKSTSIDFNAFKSGKG